MHGIGSVLLGSGNFTVVLLAHVQFPLITSLAVEFEGSFSLFFDPNFLDLSLLSNTYISNKKHKYKMTIISKELTSFLYI